MAVFDRMRIQLSSMINAETIQATPLASNTQNSDFDNVDGPNWRFDATALFLSSIAFFAGLNFWKSWLFECDRLFCLIAILLGLVVSFRRSNWHGKQAKLNISVVWTLWALAVVLIGIGTALSLPRVNQVAFAVVLAGWCAGRIHGESLSYSLPVGMTLLVPIAIDVCANLGGFDRVESTTVEMTSSLANTIGLSHSRVGGSLQFRHGVADQFSCVGSWGSLVCFLGITFFCIIAFRSSLLTSASSIVFSIVVWIALRSFAWVALAHFGNRNETWYGWSTGIELGLLVIGAGFIVSLYQFFDALFQPIPFELFEPESPLCSYTWNWLCGLPNPARRIPVENKIALRWRTTVKFAGRTPSIRTDFDWLKLEFFAILFHPMHFVGSAIDAFRGWRYSRNWRSLIKNMPTFVLFAMFSVFIAYTFTKRTDVVRPFISEIVRFASQTNS